MAVTIGDSSIRVFTPAGTRAFVGTSGNTVEFTCTPIMIHAGVDLRGTPAETCHRWVVGFTQLQFIEVNRRRYRGAVSSDGSILKDFASNRPQLCRDTMSVSQCRGVFLGTFEQPHAWNPLWYAHPDADAGVNPQGDPNVGTRFLSASDHIGSGGVLAVWTDLVDQPSDTAEFEIVNTESIPPSRPNQLHSIDLEFHFCSILTVIDPAGTQHFLRHLYWNVHWSGTFNGRAFSPRPDHGFHLQNLEGHSGLPSDRRFSGRAGEVGLAHCNAAACTGRQFGRTQMRPDWSLS